MDTKSYKVDVGRRNLKPNRIEWKVKAHRLGMPEEDIEKLSTEELRKWVLLKEYKDY